MTGSTSAQYQQVYFFCNTINTTKINILIVSIKQYNDRNSSILTSKHCSCTEWPLRCKMFSRSATGLARGSFHTGKSSDVKISYIPDHSFSENFACAMNE